MRTFTDTKNRTWRIDVNVGTVKRARIATDFVLPSIFDEQMRPLGEFVRDYELVVNVLWAICCGQHEGVDADEFAASIGGDVLANATEALVRATADFFTSPEQRAALHQMLDVVLETSSKMTVLAKDRVTETLATVDTSQAAESCLAFAMNGQALQE